MRKFVYLTALARERHFGRAAAACNVSQPALSNAMRQLEAEFQVSIIERGRVFKGFTPAGEKVLDYARTIVAEWQTLCDELGAFEGGLTHTLRLGVIPTALPTVAYLVAPFNRRYPQTPIQIQSLSSRDIQRGLDQFELDAGVTYLDNEPLVNVRMVPLYSERYFLLTHPGDVAPDLTAIGWTDVADLPLCLLTPDMQNRRIADAAFRMADRTVIPGFETNSILNLYSNVRDGRWSSVVPGQLLTLLAPESDLVVLPLTTPDVTYVVGLVYSDRNPPSPIAQALARVVAENGIAMRLAEAGRDAVARAGRRRPD